MGAYYLSEEFIRETASMHFNFLAYDPVKMLGFGCLDAQFSYVWLNESLAGINGQSAAAHLGQRVEQVGPFGETMVKLIALVEGGAGECQREAWRESPQSQTPCCYRITFIPRRQAGSELREVALLVDDITREKAAVWALVERVLEQRMFAEVFAHFGGDQGRELAHELRNRLMPMLTVAQMLKQADKLDPETLSWAGQSMEKKVLELSELIKARHKPVAPTDGNLPEPVPVDLRQLATQALDVVRPLLGWHKLELPSETAWVFADADRLIDPIAWCLLNTAKFAVGLEIGIRVESGAALLVIAGRANDRIDDYTESAEISPPLLGNIGNPLGMGLSLVEMLLAGRQESLAFSGMEAGNPRKEFILRLPMA